ncbi:MAG: hypothetical protein J6Y31_03305 [Bacteroidales bacterium]|nr:hypothetical protein [Bacteroidales bacterium]
MKHYLLIAVAAVAATVACTKTESVKSPDVKIAFDVAQYQTRANQANNDELGGAFTTNAWFTNGDGDKMQYMNNVTIGWDSPVAGQWAPARDYFWPKTGYIDFYSYDGVPAPTTVGEGSLVYTDKTIAATDNILVADAAYRQTQNLQTYQVGSTDIKGVPTLFRHALAKVNFTVRLFTTDAKKTPDTKWDVTILNTTAKPSNVVVLSTGTLTLSNSYSGTTATTQAWTNANATKPNVGWVAGTATETIDCLTPALTLPKNSITSGDAVSLIDLRTVMPQTLGDDAVFTINYEVKATYGDETTPYMTETRSATGKLADLVNTISDWNMNYIITYNVLIDPVSERILFDPAVQEWDETTSGDIEITE